MGEIFRRLVWFAIVSTAVAYTVFLVVGSTIQAHASDGTATILVHDELAPGVHHMSGIVTVPSSCMSVTATTEQVGATTYKLAFKSWSEPSVPCVQTATARAFKAVLFAPATGVNFIGTFDDRPIELIVLPALPSH